MVHSLDINLDYVNLDTRPQQLIDLDTGNCEELHGSLAGKYSMCSTVVFVEQERQAASHVSGCGADGLYSHQTGVP
jgi:hypothetical protein